MNPSPERIEKEIPLKAPRTRVWQAIANADEFGNWFGVALEGQAFVPGQSTKGHITHPGYEHIVFEVAVDRVELEHRLSFRWHPYAIDPNVDYSKEPTTLVDFEIKEAKGGTQLSITESGFDKIPQARREEAYRMNSKGWEQQVKNIEQHVARA